MRYGTLCENHLFSKVFAAKNKAGAKNLSVFILKDLHASRLRKENPKKEKINRVGISVSKRLGSAVVRNRAKRIVREAYRKIDGEYLLKKGLLVVIVPSPSVTDKRTQDVKDDLLYCFKKLGVIQQIQQK